MLQKLNYVLIALLLFGLVFQRKIIRHLKDELARKPKVETVEKVVTIQGPERIHETIKEVPKEGPARFIVRNIERGGSFTESLSKRKEAPAECVPPGALTGIGKTTRGRTLMHLGYSFRNAEVILGTTISGRSEQQASLIYRW